MQGFNMGRYVPPSAEGLLSGNALHKKHPLGSRASKLASAGILTVRFEMPFPVWCASCPKPTIIGQGVRFNAEKKRAGSYYTTPIWSFRMKHADCGGWIEVRTDPKNRGYAVTEGGRKRDVGDEGDSLVKTGEGLILDAMNRERAERRETAFGKLEKTIEDREREVEGRERIGELQDEAERRWEDPYAQNQRLRREFRVGRKKREEEGRVTEELKERMGLGIELLPATEGDAKRAALVEFGGLDEEGDVEKALARPLFEKTRGKHGKSTPKGKPKAEMAAEKMRESLVSEIVGNTRAARDPFLRFGSKDTSKGPVRLPGLKRKRAPDPPPEELVEDKPDTAVSAPTALVSYESDSD
ncbi:CWC16 protein [Podospora aff. communis PSN243]|uniref:CWC16 protein n=1 Tax=Podospora aff. communis PSN243 TaxID=3040156 RepID=A0AAV9GZS2_9PEZI|nr:CWC16 protein [Podospora aff. communis PSN243]